MKKISIDSLVGGEKLAKEICTSNGLVLVPTGSIIKYEYIQKMRELNIDEVYIESEKNCKEQKIEENLLQESILQERCKYMVKETLEKYSYCASQELEEITMVADQIMEDVLSQPEVMYNVSYVKEKSETTYSHSVKVSSLSVLIALKMGLSKQRVRDIAIGALLHDLGMVYLPFSCENLVYEECSEEQKKEIRKHTITGFTMIESEKWLSNVAREIILSHHEREDGSGYPMRLEKNKVRLETKIVSLCDEFDKRVYGYVSKVQKVHDVIDYIVSQAGRKFDLNVVRKFIESVAVYPIGTYVKTNTNEIGVVVRQNNKMPTRPVIKIIGKGQREPLYRDLVEELTIFIKDTIDIA
ncbi:MAG: HD domain-containing protein [Clostridiales bacterium]|nr:HD domain-containing protein [Clostridiales bacterium]